MSETIDLNVRWPCGYALTLFVVAAIAALAIRLGAPEARAKGAAAGVMVWLFRDRMVSRIEFQMNAIGATGWRLRP